MKVWEQWERQLIAWNALYRARGIADIKKTAPPYVIEGKGKKKGTYLITIIGKGPPDFEGALAPNGKAIRFEAKSWQGSDPWPLSEVKPWQRADLNKALQCGSLAWISLLFGDLDSGEAFFVEWAIARDMKDLSRSFCRQAFDAIPLLGGIGWIHLAKQMEKKERSNGK